MNINELLQNQRSMLDDLEKQVQAYESSDLFTENMHLKTQVDKLTAENTSLAARTRQLYEHNLQLKEAMHTQLERERGLLIDNSKERLKTYFGQSTDREIDKLSALESDIRIRTGQILSVLQRYNIEMSHPIYAKIQAFKDESWQVIQEAQAQIAATSNPITASDESTYNNLQKEPVTQEQVVTLAKKYNIERFIGLNLISIVGVILIILAAIFAGQFAVAHITDAGRAMLIFAFGGAMLIAGEIFNRRRASVLSLGITAGGVAILYVALAFSYFALGVIGMLSALGICVAITAAAFYLSTRYRSQTLLILAYAGGHLPFFAIILDVSMIYGLMVHFLILNLLVLMVSFKLKWTAPTFVGLSFNIIAVWAIMMMGADAGYAYVSPYILTGFIFLAFANYTAIPLIGTYVSKQRFAPSDTAAMALNTFFSCITMYAAFFAFGWGDYMGLLALIYAIVYFGLALLLWKKFDSADTMRDLAAITGLIFVVLTVPLQLDIIWISLGWLLQGVVMSIYGIIKGNRRVRIAGMAIFGLCIAAFLMVDIWLNFTDAEGFHFGFRYLSVTVGSLLILGAYVYNKSITVLWQRLYKYVALANLWFYSLYLVNQLEALIESLSSFNIFYMAGVIQVVLTLALAFGYIRIKPLFDDGMRVLAFLLYLTGIAGLFALNMASSPSLVPIGIGSGHPWVTVMVSGIILFVGVFAAFCLYEVLKHFTVRGGLQVEHMHIIVAIYILAVITHNLISHYRVDFASLWISVIYIFAALAWVIFGFARRHVLIRRYGLALALLTVGKVFFVDLTELNQGQRIISFFVMGAVLVGISFVYQVFSKRLELKLDYSEPETPVDTSESETQTEPETQD